MATAMARVSLWRRSHRLWYFDYFSSPSYEANGILVLPRAGRERSVVVVVLSERFVCACRSCLIFAAVWFGFRAWTRIQVPGVREVKKLRLLFVELLWQICRGDVQDSGAGLRAFWPGKANRRDRGQRNRPSVQRARNDGGPSPLVHLEVEMVMLVQPVLTSESRF